MKIRKSNIFGSQSEADNDTILKVITRFPEKWILIDTETNQIYSGTKNTEIFKNCSSIKEKEVKKKIIELLKKSIDN